MSKLIERLKQVAREAPQPIGFARLISEPARPKMLLIASVEAETKNALEHVDGADAAVLRGADADTVAKILQIITHAEAGIPWGGWIEESSPDSAPKLLKAGADFVIFAAGSPVAFPGKDAGPVLEIEPGLEAGLLLAVNGLPVEAALLSLNLKKGVLTWQDLMMVRRFANLLVKPLIVTVPPELTPDELKALWEAGVDAVMIPPEDKPGKVKALRGIIDATDFPSPRRRVRGEAIVPAVTPALESEGLEEPEEPDDE